MSVLGPALACAVGLVLLAAGASHLRAPAALTSAVRAHGVLSASAVPPRVLGAVEALLGLALVVSAALGSVVTVRVAGVAAAALFTLMSGYLTLALRRQRATGGTALPCGCGVGEAPLGPAAVGRSVALVLAAGIGAATASGWSLLTRPPAEVVVAVAAALSLAIGVALLPAARAVLDAPTQAVLR